MNDTMVTDALRAHIADEPPLQLTAGDVIMAGRRSRRRHRAGLVAAGCAGLAGVVGLVAAVPMFVPSGRSEYTPIAGPPTTQTCAQVAQTPPGPAMALDEAETRLSCYLVRAVRAVLAPGTMITDDHMALTSALIALRAPQGLPFVDASAVVTDVDGAGFLQFAVGRADPPTTDACADGSAPVQCRTGQRGERIEIYTLGTNGTGFHGYTVIVYIGHTEVVAASHNSPGGEPARAQPPLTVDQLIGLATAPELVFFP